MLRFFSVARKELKCLSFYKLVSLEPSSLSSLRQNLFSRFTSLGILGRVYVSKEGINAQISIPAENQEKLVKYFEDLQPFKSMLFNESLAPGDNSFEKLSIRIKEQVLADGMDEGDYFIDKQPKYLEPQEFHKDVELLLKNPESGILLDVRNTYEMEIGYFKGATKIETETFRESLPKFKNLCEERQLQKKPILMYCTGGIRCTKAGAYLKSFGFEDVRMLKGGITNYGNFVRNNEETESLYIGKNYTFDGRQGEEITRDIVGKCHNCSVPIDSFSNCIIEACNKRILHCEECRSNLSGACSKQCLEISLDEEKRKAIKLLGSEYYKQMDQ